MLVELLDPLGPELARRWLAVLLLVPRGERAALVEAVERRVAETYASAALSQHRPQGRAAPHAGVEVVYPPVQREGYVEQVVVSYDRPRQDREAHRETARPRRRKGAG